MDIDRFGLFKYSDNNSITFSFAFPSTGGTATRIRSEPSALRITSFFLVFGLTVILNFMKIRFFERKNRVRIWFAVLGV